MYALYSINDPCGGDSDHFGRNWYHSGCSAAGKQKAFPSSTQWNETWKNPIE